MVRIVSDTSTLYSSAQAKEAGFAVSPLSVTIAGETYREFDDITPEQFVGIIRQGHLPVSSQPAVGDVAALYDQYPGEVLLNIAMADGLSGTYNGAVAATGISEAPESVTVINSRTLCGPHRYIVEKAVEMANAGCSLEEIVKATEARMDSALSFLMPADFDYLRRGGRLSPMVSYVGGAMHLIPVMTQTEDGKQLTVAGIRRSFPQAVKHVIKNLDKHGLEDGSGWSIYVTHAANLEVAEMARGQLAEHYPNATIEIYGLSPAFITQGGPGCMAIQVVRG